MTDLPAGFADKAPWWVAAVLAFIYVLRAGLELSDMASKNWTGVRRVISPRARQQTAVDERIKVLLESVELFRGQVTDLKGQLTDMRGQLASQVDATNIAHRLADAQGRSIRTHLDWDRRLIASVRQALPDFDFPDPPELYVYIEETP